MHVQLLAGVDESDLVYLDAFLFLQRLLHRLHLYEWCEWVGGWVSGWVNMDGCTNGWVGENGSMGWARHTHLFFWLKIEGLLAAGQRLCGVEGGKGWVGG